MYWPTSNCSGVDLLDEEPNNAADPSEFGAVRIIGGKPYRYGFLKAFWLGLDPHDPRAKLRAVRENFLSDWRELYHYTSLDGFRGIVEQNGFWASDNRFMNDAEETLHGVRLARSVLRHKAKRSQNSAFGDVLRAIDSRLAEPSKQGSLVACFSKARDDLGQWRGYAAGGVCLRLGENREGEHAVFFGPDHVPYRVIYNECQKRKLLLSIIDEYEREYALDRAAMLNNWPEDQDENYEISLHSRISTGILGFKDKAFEGESEARIVLSYEQTKKYSDGLQFRVSPLGIVPYLRTGDHAATIKAGGLLPLHEVIVGPSPHQELISESIESYLRQKGYQNTIVSLSRVPYRAM